LRLDVCERLYSGLAVYLFVYAIGSGVANFAQMRRETQTGTLPGSGVDCAVVWGSVVGDEWNDNRRETGKNRQERRPRRWARPSLTNTLFGVAPVLVFLLSSGLGVKMAQRTQHAAERIGGVLRGADGDC
jgi:hypothetical protein